MATRSITLFTFVSPDNREVLHKTYYRHFDGYLEGQGLDLVDYINTFGMSSINSTPTTRSYDWCEAVCNSGNMPNDWEEITELKNSYGELIGMSPLSTDRIKNYFGLPYISSISYVYKVCFYPGKRFPTISIYKPVFNLKDEDYFMIKPEKWSEYTTLQKILEGTYTSVRKKIEKIIEKQK